MKIQSEALVNGNTLKVYESVGFTYLFGPPQFTPITSGTFTITTPLGASQWNIANAVGHAMYRHSGGLSGETFEFFDQGNPDDGKTGYDRDNDRVYIESFSSNRKYIIVHEFGHILAARANWCGSSSCCAEPSCAANHDYYADPDNCYTVATKNHELHSKELQSSAVWEGISHFYAAVAFNETSESDCVFVYYKVIDWNLNEDPADLQENAGSPVSCESGPTIAPNPDYLGSYCTGILDNRGTEYDWLRFWWDLTSKENVSVATIYDIWDGAESDDWNATGEMSCQARSPDAACADDPATRLFNSAASLGYESEWVSWDVYNGVHR